MQPDDALRLATWVEGLFDGTTPQQVEFLAGQFARFDVGVVEAEVGRFRRQFETLNIANLLRRIADEQQKQSPRGGGGGGRTEQREVRAQWERDDARLAELSDEELARRKEAVLADNPKLRSFLVNKNPRESVILRSLILNHRMKGNGAR
jgi:hypothetical protein